MASDLRFNISHRFERLHSRRLAVLNASQSLEVGNGSAAGIVKADNVVRIAP
jgi:hypothetical protein